MPFPGADGDRYPHRDEVVAYLTAYADRLDADIRTAQRVSSVRRAGSACEVVLEGGGRLRARAVIAASGTFGRPHRPALPGLAEFTGQVLHAAEYRSPVPFTGRRPAVVGAGNSAVQIAAELAGTARVMLATRGPVQCAAQRILGRDLHFWTARTGLDTTPLGRLLRRPPRQPVLDDGRYRTALAAGRPDRRPLFTGADGAELIWPDGQRQEVDAVVLATAATAPTCPTSPTSAAPWTPTGAPGTASACLPRCRGWRSSVWNGSATSRRTRCAVSAGTRSGSPGAWPPVLYAVTALPRLVRRVST
ncbi:NAD(P)-binding domain-containing protein [Streptomyces globisporus]|uniref:NAD(P)-binding domain-containing protein n=1 Tax=Streptomyces globisporus TaxID=1908 RepID=UPI00379F2C19